MFRGLLQEHEARVAEAQREAEAQRLAAAASAHAVGQAVSEALNAGVQEAYENQKRLETELRALEAQAARFQGAVEGWVALAGTFDGALKGLGDFDHYVGVLEWEMQKVADALERHRLLERQQQPPPEAQRNPRTEGE